MPNESFSFKDAFKAQFPGGKKKRESPPEAEPDTRSGFSGTPRTQGITEEPREEEANIEPQTHQRTMGQNSVKETTKLIVRGKNSKEARKILLEEILRKTINKKGWSGFDVKKGGAVEKSAHSAHKEFLKECLREIKYSIQESDYDDIKTKTNKGGPTPWRRNTNWNKAKGEYRDAWNNLRKSAIDAHIWEQNDEREFIRETEARTPWAVKETARNMALNVAVAGIYGLGYATIVAPWKAFELGLKYASQLTDNEKYTKGMMDIMFKKKREKAAKGEPKKEEWNKAKEYEVMQKVKTMEIEYIETLKNAIIEQKAQGDMKPEDYAALTDARKEELKKDIGTRGYRNVWRVLRGHWIQEGAWNIKNEKEFRDVIGGDNELQLRDLVTEAERNQLKKAREEETKIKKNIATADDEAQKELESNLVYVQQRIADIENRKKVRKDNMGWPEYQRGKKKGGTSTEEYVTTEDEQDEEEEEEN